MCPDEQLGSEATGVENKVEAGAEAPAAPAEAKAALEAAANNPSLSKEEKKEIQKQIKKFQLKIDGKDEEMEIDLADEEAVKKQLQLAKVASKRMQETTKLRGDVEKFIELLKTNPKKILKDPNIGVDLKKFAQEIINEELEEESKSPEQKEIEKLKKELEDRIAKDKEDKEDKDKREMERLQTEAEVRIESDITAALESGNIPKTPYTVKKMAEVAMLALQQDIELPMKEIASIVKTQMENDIREMFAAAPEDVLEAFLGEENLNRLQKHRVKKSKVAPKAPVTQAEESVKPSESKKDEKSQSFKDFFKL